MVHPTQTTSKSKYTAEYKLISDAVDVLKSRSINHLSGIIISILLPLGVGIISVLSILG